MTITVTSTDEQSGYTETVEVAEGDYVLTCHEPCYLAHVTRYGNGTHVLTIKGRRA